MEVKDLRIGNLIKDEIGIFTYKVCSIGNLVTAESIEVKGNIPLEVCVNYSLHYFKPIPLTEEWLEKFGYETEVSTNRRRVFRNKKIGEWLFVDFDEKSFFLCIDGYGKDGLPYVICTNKNFVHEFQNIIHSLTGEELTIK